MPDLDGVMAVSAALAPRWDRGLSRRQFPSPQGRAGTKRSRAFALSAPSATVPIELAILNCDPSRSDCQQAASHWHFPRASPRAGFGLRRARNWANGRADDVTRMVSRSRFAPTRATASRRHACDRVDHDGLACAAANAAKTFVRLDPLRAQSDPAARGNGGLWHVDVIRRVNRTLASPAKCPLARTFVLPIALVKQRLSA